MAYTLAASSSQSLTGTYSPISTFGPLTMAIWAKGAALDSRSLLVLRSSTNSGSACAFYTGSAAGGFPASAPRWMVRENNSPDTGWINISGGTAFDNTWHHICGTWDGTTATLYLDGTTVAVASPTPLTTSTLDSIGIGAQHRSGAAPPNLFFDGSLAEAAIWTGPLSQAEVTALAKGVSAPAVRAQGLVFHAPLIRAAHDIEGGRVLTNNNGATVSAHPRLYL
jgi:hypothetical protein